MRKWWKKIGLGHKVVLSRAISKLFHVVIFSEEDRPSMENWQGMGNYMKMKEENLRLKYSSGIPKDYSQLYEDKWNELLMPSFGRPQEMKHFILSKFLKC